MAIAVVTSELLVVLGGIGTCFWNKDEQLESSPHY